MKVLQNISKRLFDILFSLIGITCFSPLLLFIALAIKIDSKGPIIFKQPRLGLRGKKFFIYKFRTMIENAEKMGPGIFNFKHDPRVTRVGHVLRKTSMDELPQLVNILKGDMSIVGPRPPVTYELGDYSDFDDNLKRMFTVRPGLTGYAQIYGRNELSWDEKIEYNLQYIDDFEKHGILIDIIVIFKTFIKVLKMEGSYELRENAERDQRRMKRP